MLRHLGNSRHAKEAHGMISYQQSIQSLLSAIEGNVLRYQRFFYEALPWLVIFGTFTSWLIGDDYNHLYTHSRDEYQL